MKITKFFNREKLSRIRFVKNQNGNIMIFFALMIPAIFTCFSASINYAYVLKSRALISESTNEASLAVVAADLGMENQKGIDYNNKLALYYINLYRKHQINDDKIDNESIKIKHNKQVKEYYVTYNAKADSIVDDNPLVPATGKNEQDRRMSVSNRQDSSGGTRKTGVSRAVDVAFIVDFSGSVTCNYNDNTCNEYRKGSDLDSQRLAYIKKVLADLIPRYSEENPQNKFALIPYDIGVPVKETYDSDSHTGLSLYPKKNEVGGENYGCSVLYNLKSDWSEFDFDFWANQRIDFNFWERLKEAGKISNYLDIDYDDYENYINYTLDLGKYDYYRKVIGPALKKSQTPSYNVKNAVDASFLLSNNLCTGNFQPNGGVILGKAPLQCGNNYYWGKYYPLNDENSHQVKVYYKDMIQLYDYMYSINKNSSDKAKKYNTHYSFANIHTVDVSRTVNNLFEELGESWISPGAGRSNNIITFYRPLTSVSQAYSPFVGMCQSPLYNNKIIQGDEKGTKNEAYEFRVAENMASFKVIPRLIPLVNLNDTDKDKQDDIKDLKALLDDKTAWTPGGGTDTMTALLRAVPELAKGTAPTKLFIIISDGLDDSGADTLRDKFLDEGICDQIISGFQSRTYRYRGRIKMEAESVEIHYIKVGNAVVAPSGRNNLEKQFGKWYTKCAYQEPRFLHTVDSYEDLWQVTNQIITSETGSFVNKKIDMDKNN